MHSRQSNGSTMAAVDPHTGYPLAEGITHTCSDTVHTLNWAMVPRTYTHSMAQPRTDWQRGRRLRG